MFVSPLVAGHPVDMLLDTGAQISVLPTGLAKSLSVPLSGKSVAVQGVSGDAIMLTQSEPVEISFGPQTITSSLWVGDIASEPLLGMDLLSELESVLQFTPSGPKWQVCALKKEHVQEHPIWSTDKDDCGLLDMEPVKLSGKPPPHTKQYPINPEALNEIKPIVNALEQRGILVRTHSSSNSPVWPVRKANGTWRLTVDYRVANKSIDKLTPLVADPSTIFNNLPTDSTWFSVVDMANGFWSVPLHPDYQPWLAFTVGDVQYQWTRLPQGFHNSPTIYHQALRRHLADPECPKLESTIIQYVDDVLIASPTEEIHDTELRFLLDYLCEKGHKAGLSKAQLSTPSVQYLGQWVSQGERAILPDRVKAVKVIPPPTSVKQIRSFLGIVGYCRSWIDGFAGIAQPLYDLLKGDPDDRMNITLTEEQLQAFNTLKTALTTAPALGLVDIAKPFSFFVHEDQGFMTACLTQDHGGLLRPVAYYSSRLDSVAQGMGPCLRAVQAVYLALLSCAPTVLDQMVTVKCPHAVHSLLTNGRVLSVTAQRWGNWLSVLTAPNIIIARAPVTNFSSLMMPLLEDVPEDDVNAEDHDCLTLAHTPPSLYPERPLPNAQFEFYTDGSSQVIGGVRCAGWAVVTSTHEVAIGSLPHNTSAQQAELHALTQACVLAANHSVNIYTDSRYAFGVVHDFGFLWKQRGFLTATGTPIKNAQYIEALMSSLQLPKQLAVIKVKAHSTADSTEAKGNALADHAAKRACSLPHISIASTTQVVGSTTDLVQMYKDAPGFEVWSWIESGAKVGPDGTWTKGGKYVAPNSLLPYLAAQIHSLGHIGTDKMINRFSTQWWNSKFREHAVVTVKNCILCQQNNPAPAVRTSAEKTPAPPGPFRRLQLDYITLPPCQGKQDVLVVVDTFSRWVEAFPTKKGTATHTAKVLVKEIIPRWGLPQELESDQGTHFTGKVVQEVSRLLSVQWKLHCPYRPQASGQVERMNRVLKERLAKMHQNGVPWPDALPAVLCSIRATHNKAIGLSPHEVITGRPMSLPGTIDLRTADVHLMSDSLLQYCINLGQAVQNAQKQVEVAWQDPPKGGHSLVPGQWVMIKKFVGSPLSPKWEGPFQIILTTDAAVKCQGRKTWTHVQHCKLVPPPAGQEGTEQGQ